MRIALILITAFYSVINVSGLQKKQDKILSGVYVDCEKIDVIKTSIVLREGKKFKKVSRWFESKTALIEKGTWSLSEDTIILHYYKPFYDNQLTEKYLVLPNKRDRICLISESKPLRLLECYCLKK